MVYILGTGITPFGRQIERTIDQLGKDAALQAIADSRINTENIEGGFAANALGSMLFGDTTIGQTILSGLGIRGVPVLNIENACTSGSTALWLAWNAIRAGQMEIALVLGVEKMCVPSLGLINSGRTEIDSQLGLVTPASFAMRANRHMHEFGTTREQMAAVVAKSRRHARANPDAMFRKAESIDDVLAAPVVADPLTRSECCPIADGAAALVIGSESIARRLGATVRVDSVVLRSGRYANPVDLARWQTDSQTCALAYEQAGIGPESIDLVECHDAFSIAEILHCEALGLCEPGEGGMLAESGATALGGSIPINVSGGLLSRGHPVAATGVAQVVEIATQLRGRAGARQVDNAKVGVAPCLGGDLSGDTKSCTVAVLSR
ncbi:MAG: thiolase family protein [Thermomicrobiales bacterium]